MITGSTAQGHAQLSISGTTSIPFSATARYQTWNASKSLPFGTKINPSASVNATAYWSQARASATITQPGKASLNWNAQVGLWTFTGGTANVAASAVYRYQNSRWTSGTILVEFSGFAQSGATMTAFGFAGSSRARYPSPFGKQGARLPVTIPGSGLSEAVGATGSCSGTRLPSPNGLARIDDLPEVTAYGTSCSYLEGSFGGTHALKLITRNAPKSGVGVSLIGVTKGRFGTPYPGCFVLTGPLLVIGHYQIDKAGNGQHALPFPNVDLQVYIQDFQLAGSGAGLQVKLTNGLFIQHRKL